MNAISTYSLPILLALVVHAGIAALVMMNFESKELPSAVDVEPYYIEASVVDKNPHTVKKAQKKQKKGSSIILFCNFHLTTQQQVFLYYNFSR